MLRLPLHGADYGLEVSNLILQGCGRVANYLQGFANYHQPITI